jgi:hypothetical protein
MKKSKLTLKSPSKSIGISMVLVGGLGLYLAMRLPLCFERLPEHDFAVEQTKIDRNREEMTDLSSKFPNAHISNEQGRSPTSLSNQNQYIQRALIGVPDAELLVNIFDALEDWEHFPEKREVHQRLLTVLKKKPRESFQMLSGSLDRLSRGEFAFERAGVLELMAILPEMQEETRAAALREVTEAVTAPRPDPLLARTEIEQDQALSTDHASLLPIIAAEVFVKSARDFDDAFSGISEAVKLQTDKHTREQIGLKLLQQFPSESGRIIESLKLQHLDLSAALTGKRQ